MHFYLLLLYPSISYLLLHFSFLLSNPCKYHFYLHSCFFYLGLLPTSNQAETRKTALVEAHSAAALAALDRVKWASDFGLATALTAVPTDSSNPTEEISVPANENVASIPSQIPISDSGSTSTSLVDIQTDIKTEKQYLQLQLFLTGLVDVVKQVADNPGSGWEDSQAGLERAIALEGSMAMATFEASYKQLQRWEDIQQVGYS